MAKKPRTTAPRRSKQKARAGLNHDEPATIPSLGTMPVLELASLPVQRDAAKAFTAFCERHGYNVARAAAGALIWFTEVDASSRDLTKEELHQWEHRRHREAAGDGCCRA